MTARIRRPLCPQIASSVGLAFLVLLGLVLAARFGLGLDAMPPVAGAQGGG